MGWGADNPPGGPLVAPAARRVDIAAENSDLIEQLRELDEAHQITLSLLATANAQLKRMQATR